MVDDNYIVYRCLENPQIMGEIFYCKLTNEIKTMVSIMVDVMENKIKKYIIIYNDRLKQIKVRVFSTNPKSRKYVDVICSYEFVIGTTFDVFEKHLLESIKIVIEKTVETMEVRK